MEARYQLRQSPAVSCDSESLADEGLQRKIGSLVGLVRYATGCLRCAGECDGRSIGMVCLLLTVRRSASARAPRRRTGIAPAGVCRTAPRVHLIRRSSTPHTSPRAAGGG